MRFKLNSNIAYLLFVLLPYLKPYNITLIPAVDDFYKIWKVIATIVIVINAVSNKTKIHKQSFFLIGFLIIWFISLVINSAPIIAFGNNILSILGIMILFETKYKNQQFRYDILRVLYGISSIYIICNLMTVLIGQPFFSGGMKLDDNANFLGGDNYSAFILIVMCCFLFLHDIVFKNRIKAFTWVVAIIGLMCLVIQFALTGLISYAIFLISIMLMNYPIIAGFIRKVLNWKIVLSICICLVISIAYLHLDQLFFSLLMEMDKSGFNGRNMIWPRVIDAIQNKPLLGYGGIDEALAQTWIIAGANHAHNIFLEYPFSTGIIGTIFFTVYFILNIKGINVKVNVHERVMMFALASFIICAIFDFYIGLIWFYLLLDMIWLYKTPIKNEKMRGIIR